MISHKIILELLENFAEDEVGGLDKSTKLFNFLKKHKLLGLLPQAKRAIALKDRQKEDLKTLKISTRKKNDINESVMGGIKKTLGVNDQAKVFVDEDEKIRAGFLASYNGMIFDGRLERVAEVLSKKLKESIN